MEEVCRCVVLCVSEEDAEDEGMDWDKSASFFKNN